MQQPYPRPGAAGRPGQMTAVMRAALPMGPKVLRIGLVQSGRVVEERIIKQRTHVTVGSSEKNMFVVVAPQVPPDFRLFELLAGEYHLNFVEGMSGRVALPTGISDLNQLKGQARRTHQGFFQIKLTEDSRGKIVLADTTFLFQFVAPPPVQPKPQLPVSVTRGATGIDWPTTMIAAVSFLLHFMALGAVYSDWLDPVVNDEIDVAAIVDSMKNMPPAPVVETPESDAAADAESEGKTEKESDGAKTQKGGGKAAGPMGDRAAAALSNEMDQMFMQTLGVLADGGSATAGVLRGGEVPTGALDQAAASGAGVGAGFGLGDLRLGSGGGTIRPGAAGGGLGDIGKVGRGSGTEGSGAVQKVRGPKGSANVGGAAVAGGEVSNASRVVASMRAGFRSCYNRELAQNPDAAGTIRLSITVGPGGEVRGVQATSSGNLGSAVACVRSRAAAAQFDPPKGGTAVIQVPVTFVKQ
ncbi:AgmX/PglI C-terminal domain-containing protein [Myxococcota bacterium]